MTPTAAVALDHDAARFDSGADQRRRGGGRRGIGGHEVLVVHPMIALDEERGGNVARQRRLDPVQLRPFQDPHAELARQRPARPIERVAALFSGTDRIERAGGHVLDVHAGHSRSSETTPG